MRDRQRHTLEEKSVSGNAGSPRPIPCFFGREYLEAPSRPGAFKFRLDEESKRYTGPLPWLAGIEGQGHSVGEAENVKGQEARSKDKKDSSKQSSAGSI